ERLDFDVAPVHHDVILGMPWLEENNPTINWRDKTIHMEHLVTGKPVTETSAAAPQVPCAESVSALQMKRAARVDEAGLVVVKLGEDPVDAEAVTALADFQDMFPDDLPAGLPPSRSVDHRIDLVPGAEPPSRPTYRLSFAEMNEVK